MTEYNSGMYLTRSLAMNTLNEKGAIIGIKGSILGAIYRIQDNQEIVLGRDPYTCDILLRGQKVSRKHCSIIYIPEVQMYKVVDYSLNGCFLKDGSRLEKERPYSLTHGTEIALGGKENIIKLG